MSDHGVKRLGDHHGQLGVLVGALQEQRHPVGGEEEAVDLVVDPVDGHPGVVEQARRGDHHLGVPGAHAVLGHHRRLHPPAHQEPGQPQRDVHHDLDVHPGVVGHVAAVGVHLLHVPPGVQPPIRVGRFEERVELAVAARGSSDVGLRHIHAGYPSTR
jgi:hypothetical protein